MPERITRRRTRGWTKPTDTIIVTRPSRFGNPFTFAMAFELGYAKHGDTETARGAVVGAFSNWLNGNRDMWLAGDEARDRILAGLPSLRGKNLACYCPPGSACHADRLLDLAARPEPELDDWIARVRNSVDEHRAACGVPPLQQL